MNLLWALAVSKASLGPGCKGQGGWGGAVGGRSFQPGNKPAMREWSFSPACLGVTTSQPHSPCEGQSGGWVSYWGPGLGYWIPLLWEGFNFQPWSAICHQGHTDLPGARHLPRMTRILASDLDSLSRSLAVLPGGWKDHSHSYNAGVRS